MADTTTDPIPDETPAAVPVDQVNFIQSILNFFRSVLNVFNYIIEQVGLKFDIDHFQFAFILVLLGAFFMVLPVFSDAEWRTRVRRLTPQSRK
jgi:hypothetical protein